jgi:hypothetical protein
MSWLFRDGCRNGSDQPPFILAQQGLNTAVTWLADNTRGIDAPKPRNNGDLIPL